MTQSDGPHVRVTGVSSPFQDVLVLRRFDSFDDECMPDLRLAGVASCYSWSVIIRMWSRVKYLVESSPVNKRTKEQPADSARHVDILHLLRSAICRAHSDPLHAEHTRAALEEWRVKSITFLKPRVLFDLKVSLPGRRTSTPSPILRLRSTPTLAWKFDGKGVVTFRHVR